MPKYIDGVGDCKLEKISNNLGLTSLDIINNIMNACKKETNKAIIQYIQDKYFVTFVNESWDISYMEHMTLLLWYVKKKKKICNGG